MQAACGRPEAALRPGPEGGGGKENLALQVARWRVVREVAGNPVTRTAQVPGQWASESMIIREPVRQPRYPARTASPIEVS